MVRPLGDAQLGTMRAWLHGLSRRQSAIANNIANIDTPGYRAQQVPFEAELKRAIGTGSAQLRTTDARHLNAGTTRSDQLSTQAAQLLTSQRTDGNDVDIDQEMILLAETQMRYQAASSTLNSKLNILRNVIRGM